ncbi:Wzz/FepE/Etk N-terminal domain-containing protein [Bradyrhizobium jicamae]|nr:Wzz/FepE/Etk N-terminal domain-containing protein [Bradyrhizobium jicamae]
MTPDLRLPIVSLADVVDFIWRRLSTILLTCSITLGIAFLYLINAAPTFTADAQIIVDTKAAPGDTASVSTIVESQIEIIKSEGIARTVIGKLGLAEEDPEFARRDGLVRSMIKSVSGLFGWSRPETEFSATRHALESFQRKLSAKRVGLTYIIKISFVSADPVRAAQILNTVAETYVAAQLNAKYNSSLRSEKWVKDRTNELSSQASAAKNALANYRKNNVADSAKPVDPGTAPSQLTTKTQDELRELEAAAESTTRTYENFLRVLRYMEAQQQSSPALEAHLLAEATPPLRASSPKVGIVLGLSVVGGVLLGIAIGILRDLSVRGFRTGGQVCREHQMACIAVIPRVKSGGVWRKLTTAFPGPAEKMAMNLASVESPAASMRNRLVSIAMPSTDGDRLSKRRLSNSASRSRSIIRGDSPIWTITDAPQSRFTDSFLEMKLAIDSMSRNGKRNQAIGITSTQPHEGKSTVAAALALLIAHAGARVVLVDCNLRNQSLSDELAPGAAFGILDIMTGTVSVPETTWIDSASQMAFLPVGNNSRPIHASNLLASDKLAKLFQTLRETYEYVIVDLPPVAPFADARAMARSLDSFILVVEWGRTDIAVVERALKACSDIDEIMLGVALNKADMKSVKRYEQRP